MTDTLGSTLASSGTAAGASAEEALSRQQTSSCLTLNGDDGARKAALGSIVLGFGLDAHQLQAEGGGHQLLAGGSRAASRTEPKTYALLKEARDDGRVHDLALVHLANFGPDDILSKALDWRQEESSGFHRNRRIQPTERQRSSSRTTTNQTRGA